jgi:hypothetical protein
MAIGGWFVMPEKCAFREGRAGSNNGQLKCSMHAECHMFEGATFVMWKCRLQDLLEALLF